MEQSLEEIVGFPRFLLPGGDVFGPLPQHSASAWPGLGAFGGVAVGGGEWRACSVVEDVPHFSLFCPFIADLWEGLYVRLLGLISCLAWDWEILMLAFSSLGCRRSCW